VRSSLVVGRRVVFDATNLEDRLRRRVYDIADECRAPLLIVWVTAPPAVVQERMLRRRERADEDDASDADWLVYLDLRRKAEPIRRPHVVVNTASDYESFVERVLKRFATEAG
jgi:predicted kinase